MAGLSLREFRFGLILLIGLGFGPGADGTSGTLDPAGPREADSAKKRVVTWIEGEEAALHALSDRIWAYSETALREVRSSRDLSETAEAYGFKVTRGVAGMPTAFVAEFGSGAPVLAILAEYDALPGLSQKAVVKRTVDEAREAGHGCGHNLFGAASLGAAAALRREIASGALDGTIRLYGTPAEESVGGKLYMAREGLFDDVDVCLAWHPSDETRADVDSSQALVDFVVEFFGKTAHAAYDPWNGRSASDGAELFTFGVNLLREHVRPSVRIHYALLEGGKVPNVVPDYAKVWCWVRDSKRTGVEEVFQRIQKIARGAALSADVRSELRVQSGDYEILVNMAGARLLQKNFEWLGPLRFSDEDQRLARELQAQCGVEPRGLNETIRPLPEKPGEPRGGSTDVGDVSWVVPTLHFSVATAPSGVPWHAWPVVASSAMSFGHRGLDYAAKVMATTGIDLLRDAEIRKEIRLEFDERKGDHQYRGYIPDGPPPIPKDLDLNSD